MFVLVDQIYGKLRLRTKVAAGEGIRVPSG
jgi:hypothetical protein